MPLRLLRNYKTHRTGTSNPFPIAPELSSIDAGWTGLTLSLEKQPPCETPQFRLDQYRVCIPLDRGLPLEMVYDGKTESGQIFPGGFTLIEPNDYQARWHADIRFIQLDFDPIFLAQQAEVITGRPYYAFIPHFMQHDALIHELGQALARELQNDPLSKASQLYADNLIVGLVNHLLHNYSTYNHQPKETAKKLPKQRLQSVLAYIHENLEHDLGLVELSRIADMSRYHFSRCFKATIGVSPYQYVIQQRVAKAKQLLTNRQLSLSEIALSCGFTHQSHLTRHFKRINGITPGELLKQR